MPVVKISEKGQLVIPKSIREKANLNNGDSVSISEENGVITIKKTRTIFDIAGSIEVSGDFDVEKALQQAQENIANDRLR